jgi:uncharacterized DUF497 family protein
MPIDINTDRSPHLVLVVVYTWRGSEIRLISARKATKSELAQYEQE